MENYIFLVNELFFIWKLKIFDTLQRQNMFLIRNTSKMRTASEGVSGSVRVVSPLHPHPHTHPPIGIIWLKKKFYQHQWKMYQ